MTDISNHIGETVVTPNTSVVYRCIKRIFDIVASGCALVLLSPIFLITAIAIKLDDPGPAFFTQDRDGLNGKIFRMYKFRSMCVEAPKMRAAMEEQNEMDGPVFKITDDPRITKVGRFIRKTSIDELPQFLNVFIGERDIIEATKKNIDFSRVVAVNSVSQ